MSTGRPKTLPADEIDLIVDCRTRGISFKDTKARVDALRRQADPDAPGISINTLQRKYGEYMRTRAKERVAENEARVAELESRLERNWRDATTAATVALLEGDGATAARMLDLERKALEALTKYTDRVGEPEHAARVTGAQAEAVAGAIMRAAEALPVEARPGFLQAAAEQLRALG